MAGTIINGVNDKGDIVGFFSDGSHVNGFVQFSDAGRTQVTARWQRRIPGQAGKPVTVRKVKGWQGSNLAGPFAFLQARRIIRRVRCIPPRGAEPMEETMQQRELECLDKAIYPAPARKRDFKRIACYVLFGATMALVPLRARANSDNPSAWLEGFLVSSTIPANGDLNPYGVAFVPPGFPAGGPLKPGDVPGFKLQLRFL